MERRRLRRRFIKKLGTRDYSGTDRWIDLEHAKAGIPVWLAMLVAMAEGKDAATIPMLVALLISVPWWIFITVTLLQTYARYGDKVYMAITRHNLSREYRK